MAPGQLSNSLLDNCFLWPGAYSVASAAGAAGADAVGSGVAGADDVPRAAGAARSERRRIIAANGLVPLLWLRAHHARLRRAWSGDAAVEA